MSQIILLRATALIVASTYAWGLGTFFQPSTAHVYGPNSESDWNDRQFIAQQGDDFDFSGDGRSGHRNGGGSRSECPGVDVPLTALMPNSNSGDTIAPSPSVWVYVPYTPEQAPVGEFVLQDRDRNDLYRSEFTLPATPGLVNVNLPAGQVELSLNQEYRWYFNLYCDVDKASSPVFVQGWIQRITPPADLNAQLAGTPEQAHLLYATNVLWWDAIAALAERRLNDPTDRRLSEDWNRLLSAPGVSLDLPTTLTFSGAVNLLETTADRLEPTAN